MAVMKADVVGRVKNTQLQHSKALFPLFEAVVNSFEAIEDAATLTSPSIEILVDRDPVLEVMEGEVNGFTITDNGVGFNELNLDSFFTSDTQYKLSKGGKGLGRFNWLKAFDYAEIESHYWENSRLLRRAFRFSVADDQPPQPPVAAYSCIWVRDL
jgi:hypothetical protein